jgi:hypothetical protein
MFLLQKKGKKNCHLPKFVVTERGLHISVVVGLNTELHTQFLGMFMIFYTTNFTCLSPAFP